jgi:hypothetical protein
MARLLWLLLFLATFCATAQSSRERKVTAARDPGWEGFNNKRLPNPNPLTRQDFGVSTNRTAITEIGGTIQRSVTPAYFGKVISPRTLNDKLSASGKFRVTRADSNSGMLFGWFNETSRGWRTPNSLVFRLDGNGGKFWVFYEYGTQHWFTGGGGCFEGEQYQTTPTKPFRADGSMHEWSLSYNPDANGGAGAMTFNLDGTEYVQVLAPDHKKDGALFNRFGMFNQQATGESLEVYFSDLQLDGQPLELRSQWEGKGNHVEFEDLVLRPFNYFGYLPPERKKAGKARIGGIIWRDEHPAYYADKVGPFTLDDELFASGKLWVTYAGSDSGIYLGWFHSTSKTNKLTADTAESQRNFLAVAIEGPSRIGHYFRPAYRAQNGVGALEESGPIIRPDSTVHTWSIRYSPKAAGGAGRITLNFDNQTQTLALKPEHRKIGAAFDRFGLFNMQVGGHAVDISLDNLAYSAAK